MERICRLARCLAGRALLAVAVVFILNRATSFADELHRLPYTSTELRWLLSTLSADAHFASLLIVQQDLASDVSRVGVTLLEPLAETSMARIYIGISFMVPSPAEVTDARCARVMSMVMHKILGGQWQRLDLARNSGESDSMSSDQPASVRGEKSNFDQLLEIEQRMNAYVIGDAKSQMQLPERIKELERYIPAYNALLFDISIYSDTGSSNGVTPVGCSNIR